jgi:hypothetical protein
MILVHFRSEKVGKMKHLNNVACVKLMIGKENEKKMEAETASNVRHALKGDMKECVKKIKPGFRKH